MQRDPARLRSNFEPGTSRWAVRRAQWRALGLSDADMEKPKIAEVNTSSEIAICFSHLDGIAAEAKQAIRAAGGLPFEIRATAPSNFIPSAGRRATCILPSRDLVANDIELQVEGPQLDGMLSNWGLSAIRMFILMGGGAQFRDLRGAVQGGAAVASGPAGGLAVAINFASAGFAAASGSSVATLATTAGLAIPEMLKAGCAPSLATGVVASSGTLGR